MGREGLEQNDWQTVIEAHPLESHDPKEWLRYGSALLQTLTLDPNARKQHQQAALAFEQAKREGASEQEVREAKRQAVMISLQAALTAAGQEITAQNLQQRDSQQS